jgi:hypothetical protein
MSRGIWVKGNTFKILIGKPHGMITGEISEYMGK